MDNKKGKAIVLGLAAGILCTKVGLIEGILYTIVGLGAYIISGKIIKKENK